MGETILIMSWSVLSCASPELLYFSSPLRKGKKKMPTWLKEYGLIRDPFSLNFYISHTPRKELGLGPFCSGASVQSNQQWEIKCIRWCYLRSLSRLPLGVRTEITGQHDFKWYFPQYNCVNVRIAVLLMEKRAMLPPIGKGSRLAPKTSRMPIAPLAYRTNPPFFLPSKINRGRALGLSVVAHPVPEWF